jgi:hypothetical protein
MVAASERFERVGSQLRELGSRGKSLLKPPPVRFGAPRLVAPEPLVSWWHVAVFIEPTPMHQAALDDATVYLTPVRGEQRLQLRWRSKESDLTADAVTLVAGQLYLVPVAARKEAPRAGAIITTGQFLTRGGKAKWTAPVGSSAWRLTVESGKRRWESPHSYVLRVPPADRSNGHFALEINYDELD